MVKPTPKQQGIEGGKAQTVNADKPEVDREGAKQDSADAHWQSQTIKNPDDFE